MRLGSGRGVLLLLQPLSQGIQASMQLWQCFCRCMPWKTCIPNAQMLIWLVFSTPLKNISQLGWLFPVYGKIKVMFQSPPTSDASYCIHTVSDNFAHKACKARKAQSRQALICLTMPSMPSTYTWDHMSTLRSWHQVLLLLLFARLKFNFLLSPTVS